MASSQVPGDCYIDMVNCEGPSGLDPGFNEELGGIAIEYAS